ncbi:hypothetical protein HN51_059180 [Arachis hypogaea]|uniref:RPM1 interacting protein 13 n=1 Tax=Arachis hypogaea TaxID=3818 RepID=UPI0007AFE044|nr:uncharacterized protein LOC107623399 isoform X1 [Arachis ipaensis]XP_025685941.1 uncharacterized protein LOC112786778 isoform X1 [Arachis hypogaea]QHN82564.1 uncharacterized protein DS421_20g696960 [Arachis hypogaea]
MGENDAEKNLVVCSEEEEEEDSPIRAIVCLKCKDDIKRFEKTEDCFILDFDPSQSLDFSKISLHDNDAAVDVSVLAQLGPVACRDYPHSRHLCLEFPFTTKPHESYCEMCYCYVCDSAAPCKYWTQPLSPHCDADGSSYWKGQRNAMRLVAKAN